MLSLISLGLLPIFFYSVGAVLACRLTRKPASSPTFLDTVLVGGFMIGGAALAIRGVGGARASLLWGMCSMTIGLLSQMVQPRPEEGRTLPQ